MANPLDIISAQNAVRTERATVIHAASRKSSYKKRTFLRNWIRIWNVWVVCVLRSQKQKFHCLFCTEIMLMQHSLPKDFRHISHGPKILSHAPPSCFYTPNLLHFSFSSPPTCLSRPWHIPLPVNMTKSLSMHVIIGQLRSDDASHFNYLSAGTMATMLTENVLQLILYRFSADTWPNEVWAQVGYIISSLFNHSCQCADMCTWVFVIVHADNSLDSALLLHEPMKLVNEVFVVTSPNNTQ